MDDRKLPEEKALEEERDEALHQLEEWLEGPVLVLGFIWLVLLIVELIWGINPLLQTIVYLIWGIFVLDFALRFVLAPHKLDYLRANWLTALSLMLPALRLLRIARLARLLRLVRVVSSLNRGMRALRSSMQRRGFGYVVALTLVVTLVGAAGMFAFENEIVQEGGFQHYGDALWWTAMIMTTLGSEYWPKTAEGRVLGFLLSLYAFGIFGYVTATLATFFVGREAESEEADLASQKSIDALRAEIEALRLELRTLSSGEPQSR
ncbi:MAG TPA: potassium channel family protein [Anaerolineae bacterium]